MITPEVIHVAWNAADGYERFLAAGIPRKVGDLVKPEEVARVLGRQVGKLFLLMGWSDTPPLSVALRIEAQVNETTILVRNCEDPEFRANFEVASEPPPQVSTHGDYIFDLVYRET